MFLSILIFSSCDKSEVGALDDSMPQVIDGRVTFSSEESLQNFMEDVTTNDQVAEKLPSTFVSAAQAVDAEFTNLESAESEADCNLTDHPLLYLNTERSEIRPIVPDGPFAGLLNKDLELRIADMVYKFGQTSAKVYQVNTDETLTYVSELETKYEILSSTEDLGPDETGALSSRAGSCIFTINNETRMKGELQKNNFGFWGEFRFVTKTQKKRWGIWNRSKSARVSVDGTAMGFRCAWQEWRNLGFNSLSKEWASSVDFGIGVPFDLYCGDDADGNHSAERDGWFPSCSTSR